MSHVTCPSCGGIIGRDCFNPRECAEIGEQQEQQAAYDQQQQTLSLEQRFEALEERVRELEQQIRFINPGINP